MGPDAQQGVLRNGAPQIATGPAGDAIVSWVSGTHRDADGAVSVPAAAYTRRLRVRPLAVSGPPQRFPGYGGIGAGAPSVHLTADGLALAADVGWPDHPGLDGGLPVGSSATDGAWARPTPLGPPGGWTTVPQLSRWGTADAVATYATAWTSPFDGGYAVRANWFSRSSGFAASVVVGGPLTTNGAGGLSVAGGGTEPLLIAWPAAGGGVAVSQVR